MWEWTKPFQQCCCPRNVLVKSILFIPRGISICWIGAFIIHSPVLLPFLTIFTVYLLHYFPPVLMTADDLVTSTSFTQLVLSLSSNLTRKTHIHSLAKHASHKLGFLATACGFFSSSHLLCIYKSQIRPLERCSHVWGGATKTTLCLLDKVQSKAVRLINNPNLTKSLLSLSHRRLVGDLSSCYR